LSTGETEFRAKQRTGAAMKPRISLRRALADKNLLGGILDGDSWLPWRTLLIAAMGEPLTEPERAIFTQLTGRQQEPLKRIEEFVGVIGRRGGKSRAIATLATYLSTLCEHPGLVEGEIGTCLCIAPDLQQAGVCLSYIAAALDRSPLLKRLVLSRTQHKLRLENGIEIRVAASDFRTLRGPTYIAVIGDESAFWLNEGASSNPDSEIIASVRPALATTGGPLILISSPHARRGELWSIYSRHFGAHGDPLLLVAQATTQTMNATLPQSVVDRAYARDPQNAAAEYGAQFRSDLEAFVSIEAITRVSVNGRRELAPQPGISYAAFVDPSGGSADSMTLAISHYDNTCDVVIIDAVREVQPPFSPEQVVAEFAQLLKTYRITSVRGDRYGGMWPAEVFGHHGISYDNDVPVKSELYASALATINSARVELPDIPKLAAQFVSLERRVGRGRSSIDHPPGMHDDVANAVAGCIAMSVGSPASTYNLAGFSDGDDADDPCVARGIRARLLMDEHIKKLSRPPPLADFWELMERARDGT
jgi:hypothetical protein